MWAIRKELLVAAVLTLSSGGCVRHYAPEGYLPTHEEVGSQAFGGWIDLVYEGEAPDTAVAGELVAVTADSLWIKGEAGPVRVLATSTVVSGRIVEYDPRAEQVVTATVVGTLSTLSNGVFLAFTAPLWIIGGSISTARQSRVPVQELPPERWTDLRAFARFPQGLPPGLDLGSLQPRR